MTKIRQSILVIFTIMARTILLLSIIYFSFIIIYYSELTFNFSICHCEGDNLPRFVFDYNILGEGFQPVHHFQNMENISESIRVLKQKSGIYLWHNTINGDTYVGSAVDLYTRLCRYGHPSYLAHTKTSIIINSLNKYPLENWDLIIIQIIETGAAIYTIETGWIKLINPSLNILREAANSRLGVKASESTRAKLIEARKGREFSEETRKKISESQKGDKNHHFGVPWTEEAKEKRNKKMRKPTYKFDKEGGTLLATYISKDEAAKANNINTKTLGYNMLRGNMSGGFFFTYNKDGSSSKK